MNAFEISAWGSTHLVSVKIGSYANNKRPSISLIDASDGLPYATASANLPGVLLLDGEVAIKDYSENEGILEFLLKNNIVTETGKSVHSGHVIMDIVRLNPESQWGTIPNVYAQDKPDYVNIVNAPSNQLDPAPDEIDTFSGKSMWIINDIRIWANSYGEALNQYDLIESF